MKAGVMFMSLGVTHSFCGMWFEALICLASHPDLSVAQPYLCCQDSSKSIVSSLEHKGDSNKSASLCRYNWRATDLWVEWELQFTTACQKRESRSLYNSWRYRTSVHSASSVLKNLVCAALRKLLDLTYCPFKSEFYCDEIIKTMLNQKHFQRQGHTGWTNRCPWITWAWCNELTELLENSVDSQKVHVSFYPYCNLLLL